MWTGSLFFLYAPYCSANAAKERVYERELDKTKCAYVKILKRQKNWEEAEASVKRYGLLYHDLFLSESQLRVQLVLSLSSRQISFSCWAAGTACYIMSTVHALVVLWDKVKAPSWRQRSCVCVPSKHHENTSHSTCWSNLSVLLS